MRHLALVLALLAPGCGTMFNLAGGHAKPFRGVTDEAQGTFVGTGLLLFSPFFPLAPVFLGVGLCDLSLTCVGDLLTWPIAAYQADATARHFQEQVASAR